MLSSVMANHKLDLQLQIHYYLQKTKFKYNAIK